MQQDLFLLLALITLMSHEESLTKGDPLTRHQRVIAAECKCLASWHLQPSDNPIIKKGAKRVSSNSSKSDNIPGLKELSKLCGL